MKKLLILLAIALAACSSEETGEEEIMCCGKPQSEVLEYINTRFPELLANENLSEEQKSLISAEYEQAQKDPCGYYREELETVGASCK